MQKSPIAPGSTLAIILGASSFPKTEGVLGSSASFRKSSEDFRDYLLNPDYFDLPEDNLLYLFDADDTAPALDEKVGKFLQKKTSASLEQQYPIITDVIIYYVGHGGFAGPNSEYYLALSDTRTTNALLSSYAISALAGTLKEFSRNTRRYIILDCCFSASAYKAFMTGAVGQVASQKASQAFEFPGKGTALLCASSATTPALAPEGEAHTMFSGAMLEVLKSDTDADVAQISFKNLQQLIENKLREKYDDTAVRPEIHFPSQPKGDIGDIPFFPNPRHKKKELHKKIEEIEASISSLTEKYKSLELDFKETRRTLDDLHTMQNQVNTSKKINAVLPSKTQRRKRFGVYFVSASEWASIPLAVKKQIATMEDQFYSSIIWTVACIFYFWLDWFGSTYISSKIFQYLIAAFSFAFIILIATAITQNKILSLRVDTQGTSNENWMHFDVVLALNRVAALEVIPGFFVNRKILSLTAVFMLPSTVVSLFLTLVQLTGGSARLN